MFTRLFIGTVGRGRKIHAHINGWAMCGSGRITVSRRLQDGDQVRVCKRCAKHLDQPVKGEAEHYGRLAARRPYSITTDSVARDLRDAVVQALNEILWTAEEKAIFAAFQADLAERFDDENRGVRQVPAPVFDDEDDFSWYRSPVRSR